MKQFELIEISAIGKSKETYHKSQHITIPNLALTFFKLNDNKPCNHFKKSWHSIVFLFPLDIIL